MLQEKIEKITKILLVSVFLLIDLYIVFIFTDKLAHPDVVSVSDMGGMYAWLSYLKKSILEFKTFPTWNSNSMFGLPFFGLVTPGLYFLILIFVLAAGNIYLGFNIFFLFFFFLAFFSAFLLIKRLTGDNLIAFICASIYFTLPYHIGSTVFWGHADMVSIFALLPLLIWTLLVFIKHPSVKDFFIFCLILAISIFIQIECAFIICTFLLLPFAICVMLRKNLRKKILRYFYDWKNVFPSLLIAFVILGLPVSYYSWALMYNSAFSKLDDQVIMDGQNFYSLKSVFDPLFQYAKYPYEFTTNPEVEYFLGFIFIFFLYLLVYFIRRKYRKESSSWLTNFFIISGTIYFMLSMPAFNFIAKAFFKFIPIVGEMRAPVRFQYLFYLAFLVVLAISLRWFLKDKKKSLKSQLVFLLITVLMLATHSLTVVKYSNFSLTRFLKADSSRLEFLTGWGIPKDGKVIFNQVGEPLQSNLFMENKIVYDWLPWTDFKDNEEFLKSYENKVDPFFLKFFGISYYMNSNNAFCCLSSPDIRNREKYYALRNDKLNKIAHELYHFRGNLYPNIWDKELKYKLFEIAYQDENILDDHFIVPITSVKWKFLDKYGKEAFDEIEEDYEERHYDKSAEEYLKKYVFVEELRREEFNFLLEEEQDEPDDCKIESYSVDSRQVSYTASCNQPFVTYIKYLRNPWWKVSINGTENNSVYTVNGNFVGVLLPSGSHEVRFHFDYDFFSSYLNILKFGAFPLLFIWFLYLIVISRKVPFLNRVLARFLDRTKRYTAEGAPHFFFKKGSFDIKNVVLGIIILSLVLSLIPSFSYYYSSRLYIKEVPVWGNISANTGPLFPGNVITQSFVSTHSNLGAIGLHFGTYRRKNVCKFLFKLFDEDGKVIRSKTLNSFWFNDNTLTNIRFQEIPWSKDRKFVFSLEAVNCVGNRSVTIWTRKDSRYKEGDFSGPISGKNTDVVFALFYKRELNSYFK